MRYEYVNMINHSTKKGIQAIYIVRGTHKKLHTISNNLNLIHYITYKATKYRTQVLSHHEYKQRVLEANKKGYAVV